LVSDWSSDVCSSDLAPDFQVELVAELSGGDSQVPLHPVALGGADLTDPAVLQNGQGREQHQQHDGDERQT